MSNWIPVTDFLPPDGEEVFFARGGAVMRGVFSRHEGRPCFEPAAGCRYWHPGEGVTHWMPSPTPAPPMGADEPDRGDMEAAGEFVADYPRREAAYAFLMGPDPDPRAVNSVEAIWATTSDEASAVAKVAEYLRQHPECLNPDLATAPGDGAMETAADLFVAYRSGRVSEAADPDRAYVDLAMRDPGKAAAAELFSRGAPSDARSAERLARLYRRRGDRAEAAKWEAEARRRRAAAEGP